jgi:hypothetical protein
MHEGINFIKKENKDRRSAEFASPKHCCLGGGGGGCLRCILCTPYRIDTIISSLELPIVQEDPKNEKTDEKLGIPKTIHYIAARVRKEEMNSWKLLNPDYQVKIYNDSDCLDFVTTFYPQYKFVYHHLKSVRRFDFIRYLIVYHFGGIYAESDVTCKVPIQDWGLEESATFFSGAECVGCNDIGLQAIQWTFGATPKHPILEHVIHNVVANSMKHKDFYERFGKLNKVIHMTGPSAFTDGINAYLMEREACDPGLRPKGYVVCRSIIPDGFSAGVRIFPWYRWGAVRNGELPENENRLKLFIHHGYKGSWVGSS